MAKEEGDKRGSLLTQIIEQTEESMRKGLDGFIGQHSVDESLKNVLTLVEERYKDKSWCSVLKAGVKLSFGRGDAKEMEACLKTLKPEDLQDIVDTVGFCFPLLELEFFRRAGAIRDWEVTGQVPGDHPDVFLNVYMRHPQGNLMLKGYLIGENP